MIKLMELIDMTIGNPDLLKRSDRLKQWNADKGRNVLVILKKDKKKHYRWKKGDLKSFHITTLDGKKSVRVRPTQVHQVIELPHTGYIEKHPELKKWGFK